MSAFDLSDEARRDAELAAMKARAERAEAKLFKLKATEDTTAAHWEKKYHEAQHDASQYKARWERTEQLLEEAGARERAALREMDDAGIPAGHGPLDTPMSLGDRVLMVIALPQRAKFAVRITALESKLAALRAYHGRVGDPGHDGECGICAVLDCLWHEPLHYHHDSCPAEYCVERERDDARAKVAALEARLAEVAPVVEAVLGMDPGEFFWGQTALRKAVADLSAARAKRGAAEGGGA